MSGVINSYGVSSLLDEYEAGSRMWLFGRLTAWLDALAEAHPKRMFLLLADAGMGKSIFSAVAATKLLVRENKGMLVTVSGCARVGGRCAGVYVGEGQGKDSECTIEASEQHEGVEASEQHEGVEASEQHEGVEASEQHEGVAHLPCFPNLYVLGLKVRIWG